MHTGIQTTSSLLSTSTIPANSTITHITTRAAPAQTESHHKKPPLRAYKMVQIIRRSRRQTPLEDTTKYFWKLVRYENMSCLRIKEMLQEARHPFKANAKKEELLQQHIRSQRGLLNYGQCAVAELRTFCITRGLVSAQAAKQLRRPDLVHRLNEADDGETFDRFLDLPAELRVQVYEWYFEGFRTTGNTPDAPYPIPLAESCTLVRREVLPVYLSTFTFEFTLWSSPPSHRGSGPGTASTVDFVHSGAAWQIAMLRKINVDAIVHSNWDWHRDNRDNSVMCLHIDMGTDHKPASFQIDYSQSEEVAEGEFDVITSLLQGAIEAIDQRAGGKRLLRSDFEDIIGIFEHPPRTLMRPPTPEYSDEDDED